MLRVQLVQHVDQAVFTGLVRKVRRDIAHPVGERLPDVVAELVAPVLLHRLLHPLAELVVALLAARNADDGETLGEQPAEGERIQRREELPLGQVAGGAEDDEDARIRRAPKLQSFEQRVLLGCRH